MKRTLVLIISCIVTSVFSIAAVSPDTFIRMRQNFRDHCALGSLDYDPAQPEMRAYLDSLSAQAQDYWHTMRKDTCFLWDSLNLLTDVPAYTPFHVHYSYQRLETMARAWAYPGNSLYANADLLRDIRFGLSLLYRYAYNENTPMCGNWWEWRIGNTESYSNIVSILYDELTPEEINRFNLGGARHVRHFAQHGNMTYANLADICRNLFLIGVLTGNEEDINAALQCAIPAFVDRTTPEQRGAANAAHDEILRTQSQYQHNTLVWKKEGLYEDGTFIQHIAIPYIGTYGQSMIHLTATLVAVLDGTGLGVPDAISQVLPAWITKTYLPALYKGEVMLMFMGRGNARNPYKSARSMALDILESSVLIADTATRRRVQHICADMIATDRHYASIYQNMEPLPVYKPLLDEALAMADNSAEPDVFSIVLAAGDRVIHQTPRFRFGLAMSSNRIGKYEAFIRTDKSENNYAWYTGDGMTYIYTPNDPMQYWQYIPRMNHYRVPGTTVDLLPRDFCASNMILFDHQPKIADVGRAGGVTLDNKYASAMMQLLASRSDLMAKKSWFCFDDEVVCLGADIHLDAQREVITTIDNRQYARPMYINGQPVGTPHERVFSSVTTAYIDSTGGYYFPKPVMLHANISGNGFNELWLSHGNAPQDESYQYVLLPQMSKNEVLQYSRQPQIKVLCNTSALQAVTETTLGVVAANFWKAGSLGDLYSDGVAAVLCRYSGDTLFLNVSDPTWDRASQTFTLKGTYRLLSSKPDDNVRVSTDGEQTQIHLSTVNRLGMTQQLVLLRTPAQVATVTETTESLRTYMFDDPTPVAVLAPQAGRPAYPYNHFDGYSGQAQNRDWTVVTLENPYIRVSMLPQLGGKVWGAVEKQSGREFIYQNHVVKFRDIALRGAWTSGGVEFNFGIIGHVPTTATPVDYVTKQKDDGSVSCYVASYEWITGIWWMVEVNLPKDKAFFTTSVTWYNASTMYQPCYQWMNAAYTIRGNAEFVYPGNASITHDGDWDTYPVTKSGKDISWYNNVNSGSDMSVHVLGKYNHFYGIYWHDWNFGSAHVADYADKLGMKYFIWSKARSGAIWENLLTDSDGQYIEQQSGRMFCQPNSACALTPFKHTALQPCATDTWTEYWFPVMDINGVKEASAIGSLNVIRDSSRLRLLFSPLVELNTTMQVYAADSLVAVFPLQTQVLQKWEQSVPLTETLQSGGSLRIVIGDNALVYSEVPEDLETNRPLESPEDFNWNTAYGLFLRGENCANQKHLAEADSLLCLSLDIEPWFLPSITCLARVYNQMGRYDEALQLCRKGLSVSTYDPSCNYEYGLASQALGHVTCAKDGFSMAARDKALASAAFLHLAQVELLDGDPAKAEAHCNAALRTNTLNLDAITLQAVLARLKGDTARAEQILKRLLSDIPLYPWAQYEYYRLGRIAQSDFLRAVRCEMPAEVFIELADMYERIGRYDEAMELLSFAPSHPIAAYRKAYVQHLSGNASAAMQTLQQAQQLSPYCIFPFRPSTAKALQWAEQTLPAWQNRYYLALVYYGTQQPDKALQLLQSCDDAAYAPLFLTRASMQQDEAQLNSLLAAQRLDPSWRCGKALLTWYNNHRQYDKAMETGKKYTKRYPDNYYLQIAYANALCKAGQYKNCLQLLEKARILPYEGSTEGHDIYRDACLGYATQLMNRGKYGAALDAVAKARLWPENLGVGMPSPECIDSSREDALETQIRARMSASRSLSGPAQ